MPKYNDFDLDIQVKNIQLNAENPTRPTINPGPSDSDDIKSWHCTKKYFVCIDPPQED